MIHLKIDISNDYPGRWRAYAYQSVKDFNQLWNVIFILLNMLTRYWYVVETDLLASITDATLCQVLLVDMNDFKCLFISLCF